MDSNVIAGFNIIAKPYQQIDALEQQLVQENDRAEAYRQILVLALEKLEDGININVNSRDLLKILADDI